MSRIETRRRKRRIFRTTMRALCPLCLLLTIGAVGGMEQDNLGLAQGFIWALIGLAGFGVTAWLGGLMR